LPLFGTLAYAASRLPGGKRIFIEYAHLCEGERIKALVCHWDSLSDHDQRRTTLLPLFDGMPTFQL
jgi:hypothetical protein